MTKPLASDADPAPRRLRLALSSLYLDPNNYRFVHHPDYQHVPEEHLVSDDVQRRTRRLILGKGAINVTDLINSFMQNGWLDVESIQVRKLSNRRFLVVEGNRRVATLEHLRARWEESTGQLGNLDSEVFSNIPCIEYSGTDEVHHLVVMGLHHISGKKHWPAINQARLMKRLRDDFSLNADAICKSLAISKRAFNLSLRTLALVETYRASDYGDQFTSDMFNLFREVLKAPAMRSWLQWDDKREQANDKENIARLFSWLSREPELDEQDNNAASDPAITTGAQVRELAKFIKDPTAVKRLDETRSLQQATLSSDLLIKNEIDSALKRLDGDVGRLFQLSAKMSAAELDRVEALNAKLKAVTVARNREPTTQLAERPWTCHTEVPRAHFRQLVVEAYRGIDGLKLVGFGRINLLVGVNNAGKTSVLEALYLLAHQSDPRAVLEVIRRRARSNPERHPSWLVEQFPSPARLTAAFDDRDDDNTVSLDISVEDDPENPNEDRASYLRSLVLKASYLEREQRSVTDFFEGRSRRTVVEGEPRWLCPTLLQSPFSMSDPKTLTRCNEASIKAGSKDDVLNFIRQHLDDEVKDIALVDGHNRFLVSHEKLGSMDLGAFGEGLQRVFRIGLLFAGARGGAVLIDEFENALHTSILIAFSRLIQELAIAFDVQVFLTTHSKEAVDAFLLNEYREEDVTAYLLKRTGATMKSWRYDGPTLKRAIEVGNVDIRRL